MTFYVTRRGVLLGASALAAGSLAASVSPSIAQTSDTRANHALIVGVTDYPQLPPSAKLIGPKNDAELVRNFLATSAPVQFQPENIVVLADELEDAKSPTRAQIRTELDELAKRVKSGDFVYLQFSGHGTQQPAMDPSIEPDGLDEIFLPRDTGMWADRTKGVPNAIVDKEFREHLQAIRDKGAFIWAVFDCCHSGTMTRAVGLTASDEVERKIDFTTLGIPDTAMVEAVAQSESASRSIDGPAPRKSSLGLGNAAPTGADSLAPGGMVAFFAAQTTETTPEMPLPRGGENPTRLGLFTFTLLSKLAENPAQTYRQLGQAILQAYAAENRARPTPLFEGDLDKPVFGLSDADRIAQWAIKVDGNQLEIPAGQLHRLSPGAKLAILASPAATDDQALGYVEVKSAKNLTSRLAPIAHEGLPALAASDLPAGAYARLAEVSIGLELTVARPEGTSAEFSSEIELINSALDKIASEGKAPVNLRFVGASDHADVKLAVMSEMDVGIVIANQRKASGEDNRASLSVEPRVWLLPPTAELSLDDGHRAPSLALAGASADEIAQKLAGNLVTIFRATSLAKLSAASDFRSEEVSIGFKILADDTGETALLQPGEVPVVHPDDQVHLEARNASSKPVDINVLYIGSDYSISHMYAERLHGGSEIDIPLLAFNNESYGIERMVVVLSEALPQTPVEDLSFLEQLGVRTRGTGGGTGGLGDLLLDLAGANGTRGAKKIGGKDGGAAKGAVMIFPMENLPRS